MTRADKYLIAGVFIVVIISSVLLYGSGFYHSNRHDGAHAVVIIKGQPAVSIDLSDENVEKKFILNGKIGPAVVEVHGKMIRMLEAPCPDKICIKQGWIEKSGDSIICIPNEIYIFVEDGTALDAISK